MSIQELLMQVSIAGKLAGTWPEPEPALYHFNHLNASSLDIRHGKCGTLQQ